MTHQSLWQRFLHFVSRMGNVPPAGGQRLACTDTPVPIQAPVAARVTAITGQAPAPIRYDPDLILRLHEEHQELFRRYGAISATGKRGDYASLPAMISDLKLGLQRHMMVENVSLYAYIQQSLAEHSDKARFTAQVKKEMDRIARAVVRFAETYGSTAAIAGNAPAFNAELETIGDVLAKRVAMEETQLYALYARHH